MKAAKFDLMRPGDVAGAVAALAADGSKPLAGGQSLGAMLNLRLARPSLLVDIANLEPMRTVSKTSDGIRYGASVTHAEIEDGAVPDMTNGIMAKIASGIAYRAVRNRGTIGGSLAHADPGADWPTTLAALGASVEIAGSGGAIRTLPVEDLIIGAFETALGPQEIIASIFVPRLSPTARWGYVKSCRKVGEFAESMCAVLADPARGVYRLVIGATEARQIVVTDARATIDDPSRLAPLLAAAGLANEPATNRLHRRTIADAIALTRQMEAAQ